MDDEITATIVAKIMAMGADRLATAIAYHKCLLADDTEGMDVIAATEPDRQLLNDTNTVGQLFISEHGNPSHHLDLMYHALTVGR